MTIFVLSLIEWIDLLHIHVVLHLAAEALGLPFLSPYLQSIGSDYKHGANYATLASTVLLPNTSLFVSGISPFSLAIQLNQMKEFKIKVDEVSSDKRGKPYITSALWFILFFNSTPQMVTSFT